MAYAYKVTKVTIFGTVYSGAEIWSTGFFIGKEGGDAVAPSDAAAVKIRDEWQAFFTSVSTNIGYLWKTSGIKMATLDTAGHTDPLSVKTSYYATPIVGAGTGNGFPPQIAVVGSLQSAPGTGLGRKGRMFIPGVTTGIQSDGRIGSPTPQNIATNLATFFNQLNASTDVGDNVILASKGRTTPTVQPGVNRAITLVKVGNVFDTQRRRRNALAETYSSGTVLP